MLLKLTKSSQFFQSSEIYFFLHGISSIVQNFKFYLATPRIIKMADERDEVICELFASLKKLSQLRMRYDRAVSEVSNSVIYISFFTQVFIIGICEFSQDKI